MTTATNQERTHEDFPSAAKCDLRDLRFPFSCMRLVLPYANTKTMTLHQQEISQAVPLSRHAVLILDQAAWHLMPKLPQFTNIALRPLPAGSPGLNPAEQVWQQLRDRSLAD